MTKRKSPFQAGDRVWAYCRDSGGDEQQDSVVSQRRAIEEFCHRHSLLLVHVFADEARPGSTTVGREGLEDLFFLTRQEPQPVEGIIFWSLSRLARDQLDSQFMKADLRRRGYVLHSMTDDVPDGEFALVVEALIDWKNERYLKDLSRDVKRGLHDLAEQGFAPGGFPPRGYLLVKEQIGFKRNGKPRIASRWIPDPELAPRVQQAFQMKAQQATYQEIHDATGIFKTRSCYVHFFRNKTYLGIRKCGETEVEGAHEAIIDRDTWDAVQAAFHPRPKKGEKWPKGRPHPKRVGSDFILSGLARCPECGAAILGSSDNTGRRKKPYRYYICGRKCREGWSACPTGKIRADAPEAAVLRFVTANVLTLDFVEELVADVNDILTQDAPTLQSEIEEKQRELADIDKAIGTLLDLAEKFGAESAGARLLEREEERNELRAELRYLETQQEMRRLTIEPAAVQQVLAEMKETLRSDKARPRRALLCQLVAWVELGQEAGTIAYTFPLQESGISKLRPRGYPKTACQSTYAGRPCASILLSTPSGGIIDWRGCPASWLDGASLVDRVEWRFVRR
jgi:site-specific DNA recombinase